MSAQKPSLRSRIARKIILKIGIRPVSGYIDDIVKSGDVRVAVDIGCGEKSAISHLRPAVRTIGLDVHELSIENSRKKNVHDDYIVADLLRLSEEELLERVLEKTNGILPDLITTFGVIEHLTKKDGWLLLERCEAISRRFVAHETPSGFCPQGPEFGNPYQRHLSGWFPEDFEGLGYTVRGTTGTKHMLGYMGEPKVPFLGARITDQVLGRLLRADTKPAHAFDMIAFKDKEGVPARYESRTAPRWNRG